MNTENIKKVELHIHLDGSLRPQTVYELCKKDKIKLPSRNLEELKAFLSVEENNKDLVEYLKRFEFPIKVMQKKENLERVAFELAEDLANDGYIYFELRFAPLLHTQLGLSLDEVIESVLRGLKRAKAKYDIEFGLLLCIMRNMEVQKGYLLVDAAEKYSSKGVVGLDLAGDEFNYPVTLFKEIFTEAKNRNIPFTIHAGEARGAQSVRDAVEVGASRIGHGIRAIEDKDLLNILKDNSICLENCPISNLHTRALDDFSTYPTIEFLENGILVNLSTDNRTVSRTSYSKEVNFLEKHININLSNLEKMNRNGILSAFISEEKKLKLLKKL